MMSGVAATVFLSNDVTKLVVVAAKLLKIHPSSVFSRVLKKPSSQARCCGLRIYDYFTQTYCAGCAIDDRSQGCCHSTPGAPYAAPYNFSSQLCCRQLDENSSDSQVVPNSWLLCRKSLLLNHRRLLNILICDKNSDIHILLRRRTAWPRESWTLRWYNIQLDVTWVLEETYEIQSELCCD